MKIGTVALVVRMDQDKPVLVETLSDRDEIQVFQKAFQSGIQDPISALEKARVEQNEEDQNFGDYVEQLISQPFAPAEIRRHGLQWFKSQLKIESFKKSESQAAEVIAEYALNLFQKTPDRKDFILAGPRAKVRVLVFEVPSGQPSLKAA